jgi:hypothetical protein
MSVLETPRIYFRGQVSWDPITTNNYTQNYDEDSGETIFPKVVDKVKAFRAQAISDVAAQPRGIGSWNPHGTHRVGFYDAAVCGFNTGSGDRADDPFVDANVSLHAMLVDLEPYGAFSSQLFFNSLCFGVDGGCRILAPRTHRFTARYINFNRVGPNVSSMIAGVASVVWQTSFPKSAGLRIDSLDSPALQALAKALEADDVLGLTVRFNAYRTAYFDNPKLTNATYNDGATPLIEKLKSGGFQPNPARGMMVGVIGLWRKGEPVHEPAERPLIQFAGGQPGKVALPGTSYARVAPDSLTLDLSNCIPEVDNALTKQDYGDLKVVGVDPTTEVITEVATVGYDQYNRAAYEASAGIVTLPLAAGVAKTLTSMNLKLQDSAGKVSLTELPLRAIPSEPNLYLDEGDTASPSFQVFQRGVPATSAITFSLFQTDAGGNPTGSQTVTTNTDGVLLVPVTATAGSVFAYVPSFSPQDQPAQGINPPVNTYMYVRVHPADNAIAQMDPTWENVYVNVLANWNAMAPCMDNWLDLSNPQQILAFGDLVRRLTDPGFFEDFLFMPVTRDMSPGQRTLLCNWLSAGAPKVAAAAAPHRYVKLSGSMRRL